MLLISGFANLQLAADALPQLPDLAVSALFACVIGCMLSTFCLHTLAPSFACKLTKLCGKCH